MSRCVPLACFSTSLAHAIYVAHTNLALAQHYYRARLIELRELILSEEAKFKWVYLEFCMEILGLLTSRRIVSEIDEIRLGRWDERIKEESVECIPSSTGSISYAPLAVVSHICLMLFTTLSCLTSQQGTSNSTGAVPLDDLKFINGESHSTYLPRIRCHANK